MKFPRLNIRSIPARIAAAVVSPGGLKICATIGFLFILGGIVDFFVGIRRAQGLAGYLEIGAGLAIVFHTIAYRADVHGSDGEGTSNSAATLATENWGPHPRLPRCISNGVARRMGGARKRA